MYEFINLFDQWRGSGNVQMVGERLPLNSLQINIVR